MKNSTKGIIAFSSLALLGIIGYGTYEATKPKTTPASSACPSGDIPENADGTCDPGYEIDPSSPGCCMPTPPVGSSGSCPSGDIPANADGTCQSGYIADPSSPGCCMPLVVEYSNMLTASKTQIRAGDSIDFTTLVEKTVNGVTTPLEGISVSFLEDKTKTEGALETDTTGKATMSIKFESEGLFTVHTAANSSLFCAASSTTACELDSGTIEIAVLPNRTLSPPTA